MKKYRVIFSIFFCLVLLLVSAAASADHQIIRKSIVRIYGQMKTSSDAAKAFKAEFPGYTLNNQTSWTGSAFAVGNDKDNVMYFVTNKHCVAKAGDVKAFDILDANGDAVYEIELPVSSAQLFIIYDSDSNMIPANVVCESNRTDLALLKINQPLKERIPAILRPFKGSELNSETVWACGFPGAADDFQEVDQLRGDPESATITRGIISRTLDHSTTQMGELLQIDATINGGNSGGALVDQNGYVIGVPTLGSRRGENTNAAVSVNEIIRMLEAEQVEYRRASNTPFSVTSLLLIVGGVAVLCVIILFFFRKKRKTPDVLPTPTVDDIPPTIETSKRYIVCSRGFLKGKHWEILGTVRIGRGTDCLIRLPEDTPSVSRAHCEITRNGEKVLVRDLSKHGTYIDGKKLPQQDSVIWHRGHILTLSDPNQEFRLISDLNSLTRTRSKER